MADEPSPKRRRVSRRSPQISESDDEAATERVKALFRQHYEQSFQPLDVQSRRTQNDNMESDDLSSRGSETDFSGFDSDEDDQIKVVEFREVSSGNATGMRAKDFMSTAPPRQENGMREKSKAVRNRLDEAEAEEDLRSEKLNLKNDLELQRLISESHLLDPSKQASRNQRKRITDLRMQKLGSKNSILEQSKMPISHRKGIVGKRERTESKRREEARENGVVLEKAAAKNRATASRRERGVGGPGVGRFKGGTLSLSKRDLDSLRSSQPRRRGR